MDLFACIRTFVTIAEQGSFTRAGTRLNLSPSRVTAQIKALEYELGVRLIQRTTRRLRLTTEGTIFHEYCQRLLETVEEARQSVAAGKHLPQGWLRITIPEAFARTLLAEGVFAEFLRRYPLVRLQIFRQDQLVDLVAEGFDCGIRASLAPSPSLSLVARTIGGSRILTLGSPEYLARHGVPRTPADLTCHNCIVYHPAQRREPYEWRFSEGGEIRQVPVEGNLSFGGPSGCLDAALAHAGLTQVLCLAASKYIRAGQLQPVLLDYVAPGPPIQAVFAQRKLLPMKVQAFIECLHNHLDAEQRWQELLAAVAAFGEQPATIAS